MTEILNITSQNRGYEKWFLIDLSYDFSIWSLLSPLVIKDWWTCVRYYHQNENKNTNDFKTANYFHLKPGMCQTNVRIVILPTFYLIHLGFFIVMNCTIKFMFSSSVPRKETSNYVQATSFKVSMPTFNVISFI